MHPWKQILLLGNHMKLSVHVCCLLGREWLSTTSVSKEILPEMSALVQAWQPLMLISGKDQPQIPGIFRFTEDNGTWYFEKVKRKHYIPEPSVPLTDTPELGNIRKIYTFTLEPRDINDFQELNTYLQVTPDNLLQKKSICTLQTSEGLYALVGWTFTETKYKYTEDLDLVQFTTLTDEEVEKTLKDKFNIVLENKLVPINVRGLPPNIVDMI